MSDQMDDKFLDDLFNTVQKAKVEKRKLGPDEKKLILSKKGPYAQHIIKQKSRPRREREWYKDSHGGTVVAITLPKYETWVGKDGKEQNNKPKLCQNNNYMVKNITFRLWGDLVGFTVFAETYDALFQINFEGSAICYGEMSVKYMPQDDAYKASKKFSMYGWEFLNWLKAQGTKNKDTGDFYKSIDEVPKALYYEDWIFNHWESLQIKKVIK